MTDSITHEALEVFRMDDFTFIKCSCREGRSPTASIWIKEHHGGTEAAAIIEIEALVARQSAEHEKNLRATTVCEGES